VKFLRVGPAGAERPAVLAADGTPRDLSGMTSDINGDLLASGAIDRVRPEELPPLESGRIGAPIARPGKIVAVGLNYRDHAAETGAELPTEPILFMKAPYTMVGPDDDVLIPRGSVKTDYEVELAVIIGREARYLDDAGQAKDVIAEREYQLERGGTWDKGKSCETFNPLGPYLVTPDEVPDPQQLSLKLWVNGESRQDGNTKDMIFGVYETVAYISRFMVLEPGDVIVTGTPAGVAMGRPDQSFLRSGDVVELEIEGLGRQRQLMK
jgi:2-keto-4-pentenoate hydratase/2-oxohepta-3-ene-1,7-dioic acid hydratase in catechol pathway